MNSKKTNYPNRCYHTHTVVKNMFWAFIINVCFTIIEFIGGILFNSTAILADAVHDLGDSFALGLTVFMEKKSYKGRNSKFTFGYRRLSVLSGLVNGIILISGSLFMAAKSIERIIDPLEVNSTGMFWMAVLGIVLNGFAALRLKNNHRDINIRAMYLHLLEDVLGWVAILFGSICIYFFKTPIIDPILSLALSTYIAYNAIKLLIPIYHILMESSPKDLDVVKLRSAIESIPGVLELHDIHSWSLTTDFYLLSAHVVVNPNLTDKETAQIKKHLVQLCSEHSVRHTTLEIEKPEEECSNRCD